MLVTYNKGLFIANCAFWERNIPRSNGFTWNTELKKWITSDAKKGALLKDKMDVNAKQAYDKLTREPACRKAGLQYRGYQKECIMWARNRKHILIADEMGLGKTVEVIGILNELWIPRSVLVVCPATLKENWRRELNKWLSNEELKVDIVNYDILHKVKDNTWDIVVFDESHYIKNPKTARTKLSLEIAKRALRAFFITGTPVLNRPIELFPMLNFMFPERFGSQYSFAKKFCDAKYKYIGKGKKVHDFNGASNIPELSEILQSVMIRRFKRDEARELKEKMHQIIEWEADSSERNLLKSEKALREGLSETARDAAVEGNLAIARRELALKKVSRSVSFIQDILESEEKVVVFAHHTEVIDELRKGLSKYNPVHITGKVSLTERQKAVDTFQSNKNCRVFIGNIKAAGVGITLTAASTVIFVEMDWVPGNMEQAIDRCHRIGQDKIVQIYYLVVKDSADSLVANSLVKKIAVTDRIQNASK